MNELEEARRRALNKQFQSVGLEGMSEEEILEFLLGFCAPDGAAALASELLDRYGSVNQLLKTDPAYLETRLGEAAATFLALLKELVVYYVAHDGEPKPNLADPLRAEEFASKHLRYLDNEQFLLVCLDERKNVLCHNLMFKGTVNRTSVNARMVAEFVITSRAQAALVAHNHPSGVAEPTPADAHVTETLYKALGPIDIELYDHLIVAGDDCYSYRQSGKMARFEVLLREEKMRRFLQRLPRFSG